MENQDTFEKFEKRRTNPDPANDNTKQKKIVKVNEEEKLKVYLRIKESTNQNETCIFIEYL